MDASRTPPARAHGVPFGGRETGSLGRHLGPRGARSAPIQRRGWRLRTLPAAATRGRKGRGVRA
eukprot:974779-Lingulodinium_polyedra.AAC.1